MRLFASLAAIGCGVKRYSLFDAKSALNSYRQSLAVTGQNIANINTEGYKRREASLEEVTGSQGSVASLLINQLASCYRY